MVAPLDNDIARPANAAPLRIDRLIQVNGPIFLPNTLEDIDATAALVLSNGGTGGRIVSSVKGGTCSIANNGVDMVYTPPFGCNGLDACIYVAVDQNNPPAFGAAVSFLFCQGMSVSRNLAIFVPLSSPTFTDSL